MVETGHGQVAPSGDGARERYRRRVRTTRILFLIAAAVYPLFWLVREETQPHHYDPFGLRLLVSAAALVLLGLSYSERFGRRWLHPSVMVLVYLITGHFLYLFVANGLAPDYLIGLLIVLGAVNAAANLAFQSRKELVGYLAFVTAGALVAGGLATDPAMPVPLVVLVLLTAVGLSYAALDAHLTTHRRLRDSQRQLEAVVHGAPVVLWTLDVAGRVEFVAGREAGFLESAGGSPGEDIEALFGASPELPDAVRTALGGAPARATARVGKRTYEAWLVPRWDRAGTIDGAIGVATDVTGRLAAEERLRRRESQLAEAQAIAHLGSWEWDVLADRVEWSDEEYRIFGYEPGEVEIDYETYLGHVHEDDRARVREALRRALEEGEPFEEELRIVRPDGKLRTIVTHGRVINDAHGVPRRLVGTSQDVTERRFVEDELRQAQKMEGIGRLASGVAHNFNNILTSVLGHCDLLESRADDPVSAEHVREIKASAERAADLVRQLMAIGRRTPLRIERVDLNAVLGDLEGMLRGTLPADIRIVTDLEPDLGTVRADRSGIEQILMNLAVNARDAMETGGTLRIATRSVVVSAGGDPGRASTLEPGTYASIEVEDDGCGMDAETRERVFEPFFTTKPAGRGTGLGLATTYWIVEKCGGAITVDSEPGRGATFRIFLQRAAPGRPDRPYPSPSQYSSSSTPSPSASRLTKAK